MAKKDREEIKHLDTIKNELTAKINGLKQQKSNIDREISAINQNLKSVEDRINEIKSKDEIIVSEHAVVRYIERVLGINIEEITQKILPEDIEKHVNIYGNGTYTVNSNEFKIKVSDNVVVTVIKD